MLDGSIVNDIQKAINKFNSLFDYIGICAKLDNQIQDGNEFVACKINLYYHNNQFFEHDRVIGMLLRSINDGLKIATPIRNNGNQSVDMYIVFVENIEQYRKVALRKVYVSEFPKTMDSLQLINHFFKEILKYFLDYLETELTYKINILYDLRNNNLNATNTVIELPLIKDILVNYIKYLEKNHIYLNLTDTPEEIYKIIYDEVIKSDYSLKLIKGIEHNSPFLYKKFIEIGDSNKINLASKLGEIGF